MITVVVDVSHIYCVNGLSSLSQNQITLIKLQLLLLKVCIWDLDMDKYLHLLFIWVLIIYHFSKSNAGLANLN